MLHTQRTAAYDAKNRYSLPATLPLAYSAFAAAVRAAQTPAEEIYKQVGARIEELALIDAEKAAKVRELADAAKKSRPSSCVSTTS